MPSIRETLLKTRRPSRSREYREWLWHCATKGASTEEIVNTTSLLPWDVYWRLPGSVTAYFAAYKTREEAMQALETALMH